MFVLRRIENALQIISGMTFCILGLPFLSFITSIIINMIFRYLPSYSRPKNIMAYPGNSENLSFYNCFSILMDCWEEDIFRFTLTLFCEYLGLSRLNFLNMLFVAVCFAGIHNLDAKGNPLSKAGFFIIAVRSISHSLSTSVNFYLAVILHGLYDIGVICLILEQRKQQTYRIL